MVLAFEVSPPAFSITSITLDVEDNEYIPGFFTSPLISTLSSSSLVLVSVFSFFLATIKLVDSFFSVGL